jgi:5-methylcytosine-specific restriction endonuclease McrA
MNKETRKQAIVKLRNKKYSYAQIGKTFGVSRQRIHQIICGTEKFSSKNEILKNYFNNQCQICGEENDSLHIHHLDTNHKNNSVKNLMVLCSECHRLVHANI